MGTSTASMESDIENWEVHKVKEEPEEETVSAVLEELEAVVDNHFKISLTQQIRQAREDKIKRKGQKDENEKQYACYQCNFLSISIPGLKIHQYRNHKEEAEVEKRAKKPKLVIEFPCTFCDFKPSSLAGRNVHIYREHQQEVAKGREKHEEEETREPRTCKSCPFVSVSLAGMKIHHQKQHNKDVEKTKDEKKKQETQICKICFFKSSSVQGIKIHHRRQHSEEASKTKKFNCKYCDYKSSSL